MLVSILLQAESAIAALNCSGAVLGSLPIRLFFNMHAFLLFHLTLLFLFLFTYHPLIELGDINFEISCFVLTFNSRRVSP